MCSGTRTDLPDCVPLGHNIHASLQAHLQKIVPRNFMYIYQYISCIYISIYHVYIPVYIMYIHQYISCKYTSIYHVYIPVYILYIYQNISCIYTSIYHVYIYQYTGCHRRNGPNLGRVFLMLNYTDITQNTYIQS